MEQKDHVEVLYFHGKQRCATCMAIEKNAKEVVEVQFANELKNGTLVFRTIDISDPKNDTRLHGLHFSLANGKMVKKRMRI